jgi:Mrp family chromosome partitioning ATPase
VLLELVNSRLRVIPAGTPCQDPVELLATDHAAGVVASLRERFSRVIIDTPPIVPFTDADVVGRLSDGALIVARSGATRRSMLLQAVASVTSMRVIGTVLNDVTFSLADRDNYYTAKNYYKYYDRERKP